MRRSGYTREITALRNAAIRRGIRRVVAIPAMNDPARVVDCLAPSLPAQERARMIALFSTETVSRAQGIERFGVLLDLIEGNVWA